MAFIHAFHRSLTFTLTTLTLIQNSSSDSHNSTVVDLTPYPPSNHGRNHNLDGQLNQPSSESGQTLQHHQRSGPSFVLLLIALSIVAAWVFVTNALVILAILKKCMSERTVMDLYYLNLTVIDVLDGCLTLPFMGSAILHGEFLWGGPCQLWIFIDYSLIIGSSIGFMGLSVNYLLMVRRPTEFKLISRGQHQILIVLMWVVTIVIWIPAFLNNYVVHSIQQHTQHAPRRGQDPNRSQEFQETCGFDVHTNNYYTLYIAIVGYYVPLLICIASVGYSALILRRRAHERLFYASKTKKPRPQHKSRKSQVKKQEVTKITISKDNSALKPLQNGQSVQSVQNGRIISQNMDKIQGDDVGALRELPLLQLTRAWSQTVILETNQILNCQRHAKKELPLIIALLGLFILSRTIYYVYFGVGAFVPSIFPRDLSTSVYWILQIQGCFSPIIHLGLDQQLRHSIQRNLCVWWRKKWRIKAKKKQNHLQSLFTFTAQVKAMPVNNNIITVKPIQPNMNGFNQQ